MKHEKINYFLETQDSFQIEIPTETNVSSMGKILIGVNSAMDIKQTLPTLTKLVYRKDGLFKATNVVGENALTGLGVLDEWREIAAEEPFNVYGFEYDPDFEEFKFIFSRLDVETSTMTSVDHTRLSDREAAILANKSLDRALGILLMNQEQLVVQ